MCKRTSFARTGNRNTFKAREAPFLITSRMRERERKKEAAFAPACVYIIYTSSASRKAERGMPERGKKETGRARNITSRSSFFRPKEAVNIPERGKRGPAALQFLNHSAVEGSPSSPIEPRTSRRKVSGSSRSDK